MPRVWLAELRRSSVFRIAALNALLLTLSMIGAGLGGWFVTVHLVEKDARARVETEAKALTVELEEEGIDRAAEAIRSRESKPGGLEFLLVDAGGKVRAGNLFQAPREPGWSETGAEGQEGNGNLVIFTSKQRDGSIIAVGDDMRRAATIRNAVFTAIAAAGGIALAAAIMLGALAARRTLARMQRIREATRRVSAGDFSARIPICSEVDDDIADLSKAINAMLGRIETQVSALRRVSAEVAHDLKTPLTRVGHALDAARAAPDAAASTAALARASVGIADALRLFDSMLELARIDAEGIAGRGLVLDLAEVVQDVTDAYRPEIEHSGRTFVVDVADTLEILGDRDLLMRAISNLVENSLLHSRPGAHLSVSLKADLGRARIQVVDDGPGVDPSSYATMLRPFGRLDNARTISGNGLGLAISAAVAKSHDGELTFSDASPGLCVEMNFPLAI